ncbi:hypothetical protein DFR56_108192 [Pseudogracilibacillus auburnensis]|uniref:Uncharacterized protein n=1 Tax=Pseudogracilibacillus auburnensis TaxID=1494959 RepID=A0A2V3VWK5_9BACI|nr:hypothetical protein DFR56_108192 [Pseudogracilibacillus auburnensis]
MLFHLYVHDTPNTHPGIESGSKLTEKKRPGQKCFHQRKTRTMVAAYNPLWKYTSLSPQGIRATSVQPALSLVFTVSPLPRAAGEPPRADALWGLTDAFPEGTEKVSHG